MYNNLQITWYIDTIVPYLYMSKTKNTNEMENLSTLIGKTDTEIKALYLSAIETLVDFGVNEKDARVIVKETFKQAVEDFKN